MHMLGSSLQGKRLGIIGMLNWSHRWYSPDGKRTLTEIGEEYATLILQGLRADGLASG